MRPIDADALVKRLKHSPLFLGTNLQFKDGVIDLVDRQPTLDGVPHEEVDRLRHILNSYALQYGTVKDQQKVVDRIKQETAREIFEEIETVLYSFVVPTIRADGELEEKTLDGLHIRIEDYNTIKKKYTEEDG